MFEVPKNAQEKPARGLEELLSLEAKCKTDEEREDFYLSLSEVESDALDDYERMAASNEELDYLYENGRPKPGH